MFKPTGSWVAMTTPYNQHGGIDFGGFKTLIDHHIQFGTNELFVTGSAGEVAMLTIDERKSIIKEVIKISKGRIPVFFNASCATTKDSISLAQYIEAEGGDGAIFTIPPYLLPPQTAAYEHLKACMTSVTIPVGIYNNPSRLGVNVEPETIEKLAHDAPNFIVDKEAMPSVAQLVEVKRRLQDRVNILCCDYPKYSIVIPTLAIGGNGTANIGGNIIPQEMAQLSRPWETMEIAEACRKTYFHYYPLLKALYWFSNPIVIKAAQKILGQPTGGIRRPYMDLSGEKLVNLKSLMDELGIIKKYSHK